MGPTRAEQRHATQARILEHARRMFAASGYDRTTIRGVAAAAGVDPGLVMHYFGSKQNLFGRAIEAGARAVEADARPAEGDTAEEVAGRLLARLRRSLEEEPVESLALLRSMLTHPEAAEEMRSATRADKELISDAIPDDEADLRAAVANAALIGVVLGRHLIRLDHLADADPERVVALLRPAVRSLTRADADD